MNLEDARAYVVKRRPDGIVCPCCDQYAKNYVRKLNSAMAHGLILLYRYFREPTAEKFIHVERYLAKYTRATDVYKLRFWELIESNGSVGMWRITEKGKKFVLGQIKVTKKIELYNDQLIGTSDELISFVEALGEHFNFYKLMADKL